LKTNIYWAYRGPIVMTLTEYLNKLDAVDNEDSFVEERILERIDNLPTLIPVSPYIHCYHCDRNRDRTYTFYYAWTSDNDRELFEGGFDYQLACSDCIDDLLRPYALEDLKDAQELALEREGR